MRNTIGSNIKRFKLLPSFCYQRYYTFSPKLVLSRFCQELRFFQSLSFSAMSSRVPMEVKDIPLTRFALGQKVQLNLKPSSSLSSQRADLFVLTLPSTSEVQSTCEGKQIDTKKSKALAVVPSQVDELLRGELTRLVKRREFTGGDGKTIMVRAPSETPFEELGILGLGAGSLDQSTILDGYDLKKTNPQYLSPFAASKLGKPLAQMCCGIKAKSVILYVDSSSLPPLALQSLLESFLLSCCPDERFKSQPGDPCALESFTVLINTEDVAPYQPIITNAKEVASGVHLTKELISAPPNVCNPETLAKAVTELAAEVSLNCKVLGQQECVKRNMGAFLAVNQGSLYNPQFIHLTYTPEGAIKKKIAFVGKAICMDTGGYNLKTQGGIETMKMDMGGAAAVFGCARIIGRLRPKNIEVHFIAAIAENMVDSKAYRPGDILTASNGKTIEVGNTDAEGRLTLADALVYAENEVRPDAILDCATLTGACLVGLGSDIAAVYSSDNNWMSTILKGAKDAGSPLWPMPLFGPYKKLNESKIADFCNVPSVRLGGSIHAANFLKEFVKETPWAHIDLAGPVYDASTKEYTGYGTKILTQIVLDLSLSS